MATKNQVGDWSRVYVIGGDPCLSGWAVDAAVEKCGGQVRRYSKMDAVGVVKSALTEFIIDDADAIIITDPSAEMLRTCQNIIESSTLTASALIVITSGTNLDGRTSFASAASKAHRIYYYDFIVAYRLDLLIQHISDWEKSCNIKFSVDARNWIVSNAPTLLVSIKGRDTEVFDLLCLESEIDKLAIVAKFENVTLSLELARSICRFQRAGDVW